MPSTGPGKRYRCIARSVEASGLAELPSTEDGLAEAVISSGGSDDIGSKVVKLGLYPVFLDMAATSTEWRLRGRPALSAAVT